MLKTILCVISLLMFFYCIAHQKPEQSATQPAAVNEISKPAPDYEHDLTERCKDWIFYRDKAYRLIYEGDTKGAAEAGKIMRRYYDDLKLIFPADQISNELLRLEQEEMATR